MSIKTIKFIQNAVNQLVRTEQKNNSYSLKELVVDGIAGNGTLATIRQQFNIDASWNNERTLVAAIQTLCTREGYGIGEVDGYWGSMTDYGYDKLKHKFSTGEHLPAWREPVTGPTSSTFRWPLEQEAELIKFYGDVGKKQTRIELPYKMKLEWDPKTTITKMTCHEKVAPAVQRILTKVLEHYGEDQIDKLGLNLFSGSLNIRKIRGGERYSTHSWGIAFDFFAAQNKLKWGKDKAAFAKPEYDFWWKCWEDEGAVSLLREKNFDAMHVQFCRVK